MAVATGYSKIVTSGSVFLYDTGDTVNSYKGQPITNQFVVYGTSGYGSGADNAVNFPVQGEAGFTRLGFGQTFGGYTIQQNDVVYKYNFNYSPGACHYHGMVQSIPAGAYLTFTVDYYISPDTDFSTGNNTTLTVIENYGGGALGGSASMPNYLKGVWQTVTFTVGPRGGGVGSQAMFLYPGGCGGNIATTTGYILFRNPRVYWLPYDVPFVQGTRSTTQAMIDIVGGNTINLVNMSYGANNAISFDGTDDYISIPDNSAMKPATEVTVELVAKANTTTAGWNRLFGKDPYQYSWLVFLETGGTLIRALHNIGGTEYRCNTSFPISTTKYTHIVFTFKTGDAIRSYFNGAAGDGVVSLPGGAFQYVGSGDFFIGYSGGSWFNGQIPVAKVYNRALSPSEILSNYNHYKTRFNIT